VRLAKAINQRLDARLLISQQETNPLITEAAEARALLAELRHFAMLPMAIGDRKAYRDAMAAGKGVTELNNSKAAAEIEALATAIYGSTTDE
jgi:chromosome partitioning protein